MKKKTTLRRLKREYPLHLMVLPALLMIIIFNYIPMAGVKIAFEKFIPAKGFWGAQRFIGLDNFRFVLSLPTTRIVLRNTVLIAASKIILGLAVPILFALLLNELRSLRYRRALQTIVYFPNFLSWVIMAGILMDMLSPQYGLVNEVIKACGGKPIFFLGDPRWFPSTMVITDVWKNFGFKSVIYIAAMTSIDPGLYEAAAIDGAGKLRQTWHVTLPGIRMIVILMTVLSLGDVLNAGFDQVFNLINPRVYDTGDIIDTLVYRMGLIDAQFGPATAVGLFKSLVSFVLIASSYFVANKWFAYRIF
ncbi:MAG: ABC transporter permease subunit [Oscillospiraceae bacterium]|jgi:putative aldouronate transport system permease protein|nr:ABC transporter permease subunit [Oscillospiraceae bacterium]